MIIITVISILMGLINYLIAGYLNKNFPNKNGICYILGWIIGMISAVSIHYIVTTFA